MRARMALPGVVLLTIAIAAVTMLLCAWTRKPVERLPVGEWCWPTEFCECVDYVVKPGESIWSIARELYPNQDIRLMEWAIRRANQMDSPQVRAWQTIVVPDPELYGR